MHIAIKNPAVTGPGLEKQGDYHFGASLQKALEALGARVTQEYWPEWDGGAEADAVLVLRGRYRYRPRPGQLSLLWGISHPSTVTAGEIDGYDLVYLGSETHRQMVADTIRTPVAVLRQCSDFAGAASDGRPASERRDVIFVGNSRGVFRDIIQWSLDAGVRPAIYGGGWDPIGLGRFVVSSYVENDRLPTLYGGARLGLNDHWNDQKHFGYINNRLFDCLFSGLPVLSDTFPELRETFGDGILHATDVTSFRTAYRRAEADYDGLLAKTLELGRRLRDDYTFAARARRILDDIGQLSPADRRPRAPAGTPAASGAGEHRPAFTLIRDRLAAKASEASRQYVLLVNPSREGAAALEGDGILVITAGIGPGPFEVGLDAAASELAHRRFDAVVVESLTGPAAPAPLGAETLRALHRLVRKDGYLVVPKAAPWQGRSIAGTGDGDYGVFTGSRSLRPRSRLLRGLAIARRLRAGARR